MGHQVLTQVRIELREIGRQVATDAVYGLIGQLTFDLRSVGKATGPSTTCQTHGRLVGCQRRRWRLHAAKQTTARFRIATQETLLLQHHPRGGHLPHIAQDEIGAVLQLQGLTLEVVGDFLLVLVMLGQ